MDTTVARDSHQRNYVRRNQFLKRVYSNTTLEDNAYDVRASRAALISEQIDIAP
jgi:hypothetical protein